MPALANDAAQLAEQCNRDGNRALREKDFLSAVKSYTQGLENAANDELRSVLFSNRSSAYAHLERWQDALDDANSCRDVRPGWHRSHACRGAALEGLARPSEALDAFRTALQIDPANVELRSIVEELEGLEKVQVPQSNLKGEGEAISDMYTANGASPHSSQGGEPQAAPSEREYMGPAFCNRIPGTDKRGGVGMALVLHPSAGANGQGDVFVDGLPFLFYFYFCLFIF
jgi:tetratricopeptide (TPR) repeat protein